MATGIGLNTFLMVIIFIPAFFIQKLSQKSIFYGVRIPSGFDNNYDLKEENKRYKKKVILWFAIVYLLSSLFIVNINEAYSPIVVILAMFVYIFIMQWCFYKTNKEVKAIKLRQNWRELLTDKNGAVRDIKRRTNGENLINRDDDDNYIWGMFYYNPNDRELWVEKRAGIGWTINMARSGAKIFMSFVGLFLIGALVIVIYVSVSMNNVDLSVTADEINIKGMYSENIKKSDIKELTIEQSLPQIASKQNGGDIGNKKLGYFKTKAGERVKLFIEDDNKPVIKIVTTEKIMYINFQDDNKTREIYDEIKK